MKELQEYWALVLDVWHRGVAGVSVGQIVSALLIILLGFAVRDIFSRIVINRLKFLAKKTTTKLDDLVIEALERPLAFLPLIVALFFAAQVLHLNNDAEAFAANINRSLIAFTLFWALYAVTDPVGDALMQAGHMITAEMMSWLAKAAKIGFVGIGAAVILEIWGIKVGPLLAGLGLFGVAVALGAQDLFKNLIAGLFIIGEQRFRFGDWIRVDGVVEGTVERIGFRTTTVRRFDKAEVYVPNGKLSDNAVTNFTRMTHRRISWTIGVTYDTSLAQLRAIRNRIEAYLRESDDIAEPPEAALFVRIDQFGASSIDIMLYCFTKTTIWGEWLEAKEKLALMVKEIVESEGSAFAFPSRSLYVESLPPSERPEIFPLGPKTPPISAKENS